MLFVCLAGGSMEFPVGGDDGTVVRAMFVCVLGNC